MNDSLFSIIIPVYNAENYILTCLKATQNQTCRNIEIIVIDDGSEDGTLELCNKIAQEDKRIKVIKMDNGGVSAARNYGISQASGDYIVFFDADDYPEPTLLEEYIKAIDQWQDKELSFILCGIFFDNKINKNVDDYKKVLEVGHGYIEGENYLLSRNSMATLAWLDLFNFVTNKCYKLSEIKRAGIKFNENIHIGEDLLFNLDYLDVCQGNVGMVNKALYHYIKWSNESLSLSYHEGDIEDIKSIYRRFIEWEIEQEDSSKDDELVIKSIYLKDWVSRLTSLYTDSKNNSSHHEARRKCNNEVGSKEFQTILNEVYRVDKISKPRYWILKLGKYDLFYFFRGIYQVIKG